MWCKKEDRAKVFVVAEIGQNHQGSLEIAKQMIRQAKVTRYITTEYNTF